MNRRRSTGCALTLLAAALAAAAGPAAAQEAPPYDPAIDVQLFEYAIGPKAFFAVADATLAGKRQLAVDLFVTFLTNPFTIYNVDQPDGMIEGARTRVVESVLAGDISAAYGLSDRFQVGLDLPIILSEQGQGLEPETAGPDPMGLRVRGTGDLRGELKARLFQNPSLAVAGALGLTLPTSVGSGGAEFIGDDLPSLRGKVMGQWTAPGGMVSLGANLGLIFRKPRTVYASTIGQQLTWGLAGTVRPTERFALVAEAFGRTGLGDFDLDQSPMEVEGGVRIQATRAVSVVAGGGAGVVKGIGSPEVRVFASLGWAPDTRDGDGDGIANNRDDCPSVGEDRDGWKDDDGCPDDDNDGDRRDDRADKCPTESEDFDGYDDDDGCPELDNDGDGIADLDDTCTLFPEDGKPPFPTDGCPADKRDADQDGLVDTVDTCPSDPEDTDGFEDWDGCPDDDQDKDGVADDVDQCPVCPEDLDKFADDDGCPDSDNDGDGLADGVDRCPDDPEVINGIDDLDGCGDEDGALLVRFDGERLTPIRQPTFDARGLNRGGQIITDQIGLTMLQHPEVTRWILAVAAASEGEARNQATWIHARLLERGVEEERISVVSSAGTPQVGLVVQEKLELPLAPVCPAGREVVPRPAPTPGTGGATSSSGAGTGTGAAMTGTGATTTTGTTTTGTTTTGTTTTGTTTTGTTTTGTTTTGTTTTGTGTSTGTTATTTTGTTPSDGVPAAFDRWQGVQTKIAFERDQLRQVKGSPKVLDELASLLKANPEVAVIIAVHTDARRPADESQVITDGQADQLRGYLLGKGVRPEQVDATGYGSTAPLPGVTGDKNRRIELSFRSLR